MTELAASPLDWVIAALLVAGSLFALVGALGLARFSDFFRRVHGPTKATTLGVGGVLIASSLYFSDLDAAPSLRELLVVVFLFVTAPVSAQLLMKAALAEHPDAAPPVPDVAPAPSPPEHGASGDRADNSEKS